VDLARDEDEQFDDQKVDAIDLVNKFNESDTLQNEEIEQQQQTQNDLVI
jgi:hypothetical protein